MNEYKYIHMIRYC